MPSRQHSSAMLSSPRNPSRTIRIFSSALYCLRVLRLMSRMIFSDDDCRPVGLCFISNPQLRMNKNSLLNQIYICPIGADGVQADEIDCVRDCARRQIRKSSKPIGCRILPDRSGVLRRPAASDFPQPHCQIRTATETSQTTRHEYLPVPFWICAGYCPAHHGLT